MIDWLSAKELNQLNAAYNAMRWLEERRYWTDGFPLPPPVRPLPPVPLVKFVFTIVVREDGIFS